MINHSELLNYLRFTPTGDNAQQFRFKVDGDAIHIYHLHSIALHKFNQSNVASYLSLGMIVHVLKLFAGANDLKCDFTFPEVFPESGLWLTCHFTNSLITREKKEDSLKKLEALDQRYTDRGAYGKGDLNLDKYKTKYSGMISFKNTLNKSSYGIIERFECMIFDDLEAFRNIEKWVRYNPKELSENPTGMSSKNIGLDFFTAILFKKYKNETILHFFLRPLFKLLTKLKVKFIYPASSGFGLCYLKGTSDHDIISMGERIMDMWLDLTADGFTLQPISSCTILPFIYRNRNGNLHQDYKDDFGRANTTLNNEFGTEGEVIWLFRYGPATSSQNHNRTRRYGVEEITYREETELKLIKLPRPINSLNSSDDENAENVLQNESWQKVRP